MAWNFFSLSPLTTKYRKVTTSAIPTCLVLKCVKYICSSSALHPEHSVNRDRSVNSDSFLFMRLLLIRKRTSIEFAKVFLMPLFLNIK